MPSKPARGRSRSASRTQPRTPSPKKPARKSSPARKASPSRSAKKTPAKKNATTPTPAKSTGRRTRSRSSSRPNTPAKGRSSPTHKTPIKVQTPLAAARPASPSGSTRPRRAAAVAARESLRGTESSRVLPVKPRTTAVQSSWIPRINWPNWRQNKRRVEHYLKKNAKCLFYAILLIMLAGLCYYFQRQISKNLNQIATNLQNIYEDQRKRFQ